MHKTCPINFGHLADLQKKKKNSYNWSKQKTFHLIKYLLTTFIFFPFFSICTCIYLQEHGVTSVHGTEIASSWKTTDILTYIANDMAADDLAYSVTFASAVVVPTFLGLCGSQP